MPSIRLLISLLVLSLLAVSTGAQPSAPLASYTQLIVVTTSDWNAPEARLQRFERSGHKPWKAVGDAVTVVVGKNGLGWGAGVVPMEQLRIAADDPVKKEGDGRAPAGIFRLSRTFGYAPRMQSAWNMPYVPLTQSVECVDDVSSKFYNRIVYRGAVAPDWNSSEHMLRGDELYRWGIVVEHNSSPVKAGVGSCIFMHIWRGPGQGTVGCTAMPQAQLENILGWIDAKKKPLLVQLPAAQYEALRTSLKLPKLGAYH
jgi:L,D-peptidoglycan transpeptidase YkuD (ErfK/YbiS/YcfS/YnhG family)